MSYQKEEEMAKKRELTKARIIRDLNVGQSVEIGIMFMAISIAGIGLLIWQLKEMIAKLGVFMAIIGMFALAFGMLGFFMLSVALKDRKSIKAGNFHIFKDTVKRVESENGTISKRVYFEEYTRLRGFGAVNLNIDKINVGDKYILVKLPSSNFVALAYPCSAFNIGEDVKDFVKKADLAFTNK